MMQGHHLEQSVSAIEGEERLEERPAKRLVGGRAEVVDVAQVGGQAGAEAEGGLG